MTKSFAPSTFIPSFPAADQLVGSGWSRRELDHYAGVDQDGDEVWFLNDGTDHWHVRPMTGAEKAESLRTRAYAAPHASDERRLLAAAAAAVE